MSFQEYCDKVSEVDGQKISINNTFVIGFGNSKGQIFTIDPTVAISFMKFLDQSHTKCYSAWEETPRRKESYTQYEEKSYRAIFQAASEDKNLVAISSLGGSQTRPLTELLSKLICYLGQFDYVGVEKNSYFDVGSVQKALGAVPSDLTTLAGALQSQRAVGLKERFKAWMRNNKLSEKTISSYSEDSITLANQIIRNIESEFASLYSTSELAVLDFRLRQLDSIEEWNDRNVRGNGMYRAGLNKYKEFIQYLNSVSMTNIPKPFILLAGISGTGKTRFVREQAKASHRDGGVANYSLISVRPDWHEPSDLLGYVSRISANGGARYVVTDLLKFVVQAWQNAALLSAASAAELPCKSPGEMMPFWLCLDEMNLAPVEQYFADYLSVVETRKWDAGNYTCDPLLKAATIDQMDEDGKKELRKDLKLEGSQFDGIWAYFLKVGIPLPPNLIVAGTVNMDETTHGFSRKVIDRAFTIDFGVFYPNDFGEFFNEDKTTRPRTLGFPVVTDATKASFTKIPEKSIAFLTAINEVLKTTPFELAYRAFNELLLALVCFHPKGDAELLAVWDDFLMSKVLPRIDGDAEKLSLDGDSSLLTQLIETIDTQFAIVESEQRPDLLREKVDGSACMVNYRAKQKLIWMHKRLRMNGFTTFWP